MAGNSEAGRLVKIHEQQKSEQGRTQGPRQRKKFPVEKSDCLSGRSSVAGYRVSFGISGRDKGRTGRNACAGKFAGNHLLRRRSPGRPTPAPQEEISGVGEETSHIHTEECYEGEGSLICGNDTEKPDENMPGEPGDSSGQQETPEQEETEETGNGPVNTIPDEPEITDQEESESTDTPDGQENPEQNPAGDQENRSRIRQMQQPKRSVWMRRFPMRMIFSQQKLR